MTLQYKRVERGDCCSTILGTGDIAHAGTDSTQVEQTKSYTRVADGWRIVFVILLQ
jgi:hypothetical protein